MTEFFKTILIFTLTLSMIFLLVCFFVVTVASDALSPGDLLHEFSRASGGETSLSSADESDLQTAAFPCQIAFLNGMGQLYMPVSYQEYNDALRSTEQFFEEAIGSAYDYKESSEGEYLAMLLSRGVMFVYDHPMPLYMLCAWSDLSYSGEDINVSSLLACIDEDSVSLFIKDDAGSYHSFQSQSDAVFLSRLCSSFSPNGTISAMDGSFKTAPDLPILHGGITMPSYNLISVPDEDEPEISRDILSSLSINPYLASVYRDGDTTIYMEENNRLHLYADGHLSYSVTEAGGGISISLPEDPSENANTLAVTEAARKIVSFLWDEFSDSRVKLSLYSIETSGDTVTVFFEAYIGGCFISLGDKAAAAVMAENGKITNISLYPVNLQRRESTSILPYTQAQAAAQTGAVLRIQYVLKDDMSLIPIIADVKEDK